MNQSAGNVQKLPVVFGQLKESKVVEKVVLLDFSCSASVTLIPV